MFFLKNFITFCDGPEHWQIFPQDPATPMMEGMIDFHNYLVFFIITIGIAVCWVLFIVQFKFNAGYAKPYVAKLQKFNHSSVLEIIWTIIPAVILVIIAIPSFALLYSLDELIDPAITLWLSCFKRKRCFKIWLLYDEWRWITKKWLRSKIIRNSS